MAQSKLYGVVLRRGMRYRFRKTLYLRNVPKLVDREIRDYLVDDTGFFADILLDAKGKPVKRVKKAPKRRRTSKKRVQVHGMDPDLMDTGAAQAVAAIPADTEGAQEA